jgi:TolB protein
MNKLRYPGLVLTMLLLMLIGCEKDDSSANSQLTGKIIGRISDARTNLPIIGASISTNPSTEVVTSDSAGQYGISKIAAGRYTVSASKSGYTPNSVDVTARSDTLVVADIKLSI